MLDLGFREDLEFILAAAPADRRTLMFSATVPKPIAHAGQALPARCAAHHRIAARATSTTTSNTARSWSRRPSAKTPSSTRCSISTRRTRWSSAPPARPCSHLTSRLANRGFSVVSLSGELSQAERTNALQAMRDGRARVCVATDVAARGIDLPNLDLVIHADLPTNPETLLHRSGRTGRAGRKGICALIVPLPPARQSPRACSSWPSSKPRPSRRPARPRSTARNRERILADPALTAGARRGRGRVRRANFWRPTAPSRSPRPILRQQLAARPAAEELSEALAAGLRRRRKGERPDARFENGVWFTISVGRKHRAEPRWLLPLICKAGNVTKREIGSIRILDTESRFEIIADRADGFAAAMQRTAPAKRASSSSVSKAAGNLANRQARGQRSSTARVRRPMRRSLNTITRRPTGPVKSSRRKNSSRRNAPPSLDPPCAAVAPFSRQPFAPFRVMVPASATRRNVTRRNR